MDKFKIHTVAAIDVGTNSIRMAIAQINKEGETILLEDLKRPTNMGRDTFSFGRIQVQTINETCKTLKGFSKLMKDYRIKHYRAICTSGIREAQNREYVLEQIRIKTGLNVEIINSAQERFLMYKGIRYYEPEKKEINNESLMILDIGAGGIEISVYLDNKLMLTEYVKVGILRLSELLSSLEKLTLDFPSVMEEFIDSRIDFLKPLIKKMNVKNFIGLGGELNTIISICDSNYVNSDLRVLNKKSLKNLYLKIHSMTTDQIIDSFNITRSQAEILLPSVILFYRFIEMTSSDEMYAPLVSLRHGLLIDIIDEKYNTQRKTASFDNIINSVMYIGKKFSIDLEHCKYLENLSLSIFDQTKKIHCLGDRERLYLRVSSILHDVGKYINLNQHDFHSYNIILFQDIMGLSNEEVQLIANVARYHSEVIPHISHNNYNILSNENKIVVSKLAAILRCSEALDISHKQKIKGVKLKVSDNELLFNIETKDDLLLEKSNFVNNVTFFQEVMGYKPVLVVKHK